MTTTATVSGILVVDKPAGWTSHQVVGLCRRLYGTKRVGHAGTLDPMATGVLIVGVGRATRLLGHLALHDKRYLATIRLGESTSTDDAEGTVTARADATGLTDEQIADALDTLRGRLQQIPSSVSAIKVDGRRAYALVRAGKPVHLAARQVEVTRLDLLSRRVGDRTVDLDVDVECSSGTYVRALARDLGTRLGVGGHLTALRRIRVGRYGLELAVRIEPHPSTPPPLMSLADAARMSFPTINVEASAAHDVALGRELPFAVPGDPAGILGPDGDLLALYRPAGAISRPVAVFVG